MRERDTLSVLFPLQQNKYSEIIHMIDKGNGAGVNYDMGEIRYVYDSIDLSYYTRSSSYLYIYI